MATEVVVENQNASSNGDGERVNPPCSEPGSITSVVGKKIQQFSKHDTVKLGENNFLLWKYQIMLVLEGYDVQDFVLGTINIPAQFIVDKDGQVAKNPKYSFHMHQDKLLASWLILTISDEILIHLTNARTSFDVWTAIERKFATKSNVKMASLWHALYSQKKG